MIKLYTALDVSADATSWCWSHQGLSFSLHALIHIHSRVTLTLTPCAAKLPSRLEKAAEQRPVLALLRLRVPCGRWLKWSGSGGTYTCVRETISHLMIYAISLKRSLSSQEWKIIALFPGIVSDTWVTEWRRFHYFNFQLERRWPNVKQLAWKWSNSESRTFLRKCVHRHFQLEYFLWKKGKRQEINCTIAPNLEILVWFQFWAGHQAARSSSAQCFPATVQICSP